MFNSNDINKIKNTESRVNFEYVLQSFYSKNYKATVLLLYNLLVNDLYDKLIKMNDKGYVNSKQELEKIENILKEENESKYSVVEEEIFKVYKTKNILNHSTLDLLYYFKKIRNKCAHPIFFKESDYTPTQEEVYLFIIKFYDDILIIDAFFKDPYVIMKSDIEKFNFPDLVSRLIGLSSLEKDVEIVKKYFEKKYFKNMTDNNFIKLFRTLLDLTISKKTEEIQKNQYKHFLILKSMLDYLKENGQISLLFSNYNWEKLNLECIYDDSERDIYSNEWFGMSYLLYILQYDYTFVQELSVSNEIVYDKISEDIYQKGNLFINFWYVFDKDINLAIKKITDNINCEDCCYIIKRLESTISINKIDTENIISLMKKMISNIPIGNSYDEADLCIDTFIEVLRIMTSPIKQEKLEDIFGIMDYNRQIYDKRRKKRDIQMSSIISLGYDLSKYDNLQTEI